MKVSELIKQLKKLEDKEIFVSIDEEGNDFKPIDVIIDSRGEYETQGGEKLNGYIIYPLG